MGLLNFLFGEAILEGKIISRLRQTSPQDWTIDEFSKYSRRYYLETRVDSFSKSIDNIILGIIYDVSKSIVDEQMNDFSSICLGCIIDLGIENDLFIDMSRLDNETIVSTITDFNSKINNLPYKYIFANKYEKISCTNIPSNWPEERLNDFLLDCVSQQIEEFNYTLRIMEIPDLDAVVNDSFIYDVNGTGFNITFSDTSNLFEIDKKTGLINFTPTEEDIGPHIIWIRAVDSLDNIDFESFQLKIINSS